jgi:hypothetical protein
VKKKLKRNIIKIKLGNLLWWNQLYCCSNIKTIQLGGGGDELITQGKTRN